MKTRMTLIAILLFTATLIALAAFLGIPPLSLPDNSSKAERSESLDRWLNRLYKSGKFQGVVLLANKDGIVFTNGYGYADSNQLQALDQHTSFNLASVSKQFTAAGVMLLKQQGKLSYDDKIQEFIPELSLYSDVTVQHLLHHTAGIPDYLQLASQHLDKDAIVTTDKLLHLYSTIKPAARFKPGDKFEYSNIGYVLLAKIITRVSGMPYPEFMQQRIFQPLQMTHTSVFNLLSDNPPEKRAYGLKHRFVLFGSKQPADLNRFDGVAGDGGVYASAYDLFLWHQALQSGELITLDEQSEALRSGRLNNGKPTGYGFGWFINDDGSVEHAGGWQGFATWLYRNPASNQLIVVLDNSGNIFRVTSKGMRYNSIPLNLQYALQNL